MKFALLVRQTRQPDELFKLVDLYMREATLGLFGFKLEALRLMAPLCEDPAILRFVLEYYEVNFAEVL